LAHLKVTTLALLVDGISVTVPWASDSYPMFDLFSCLQQFPITPCLGTIGKLLISAPADTLASEQQTPVARNLARNSPAEDSLSGKALGGKASYLLKMAALYVSSAVERFEVVLMRQCLSRLRRFVRISAA
jgi:hypothetical protein